MYLTLTDHLCFFNDLIMKIIFTRRIYGYPEFDNTLVDSFVSFTFKRGHRQITKEVSITQSTKNI